MCHYLSPDFLLYAIPGYVRLSLSSQVTGIMISNFHRYTFTEFNLTFFDETVNIFNSMENLELGAFLRNAPRAVEEDMDRMFDLFPRLKERLYQYGATLSGGEQQMLATARALMARPKLLLMDEPSMGLAPVLVENSFEIISRINGEGVTIFVVEQNANMALSIADRGYVLQLGTIVLQDQAENLLNNEMMKQAYLATG